MTFQSFTRDPVARHRYWARSYLGWRQIDRARPNAGHHAVTILQRAGLLTGIVTQNVDGLQQAAGAEGVAQSPFVRLFSIAGVPAAAGVMNFVALTAALSAMNTNLYLNARTAHSLARDGFAPAPGANGQPPKPAKDASITLTPVRHAASTLVTPIP